MDYNLVAIRLDYNGKWEETVLGGDQVKEGKVYVLQPLGTGTAIIDSNSDEVVEILNYGAPRRVGISHEGQLELRLKREGVELIDHSRKDKHATIYLVDRDDPDIGEYLEERDKTGVWDRPVGRDGVLLKPRGKQAHVFNIGKPILPELVPSRTKMHIFISNNKI